jgi:hypothetical protein
MSHRVLYGGRWQALSMWEVSVPPGLEQPSLAS